MTRLFGRVALLAAAGVIVATLASANVPIAELSTTPKCIPIAPNGGLSYVVTILGNSGPINGSRVLVRFNTVGDSLVCWCNSSPYIAGSPHQFTATTLATGVATFSLANGNAMRGGGCIQKDLASIPGADNYAAEVFADFVPMGQPGTVSPDVVDQAGRIATDSSVWDPVGNCATGLSDATKHTTPLSTSNYQWCTDINCTNTVTLADATILTPFLANAVSCPGNAGQP